MVADTKLIKLLGINAFIVLVIVVTASGLSGYTENARESALSSRIAAIEESVYALETFSDNLTLRVRSIMPMISSVSYDLKSYLEQELITRSFYESSDEKLVSLMVLYLKTVRQVLDNDVLVLFFCVQGSQACDYENFVLSYLEKKYHDNVFIMFFDGESTHPLIRLVMDKYGVSDFPFMLVNGEPVTGFVSSKHLEELILSHASDGFAIESQDW